MIKKILEKIKSNLIKNDAIFISISVAAALILIALLIVINVTYEPDNINISVDKSEIDFKDIKFLIFKSTDFDTDNNFVCNIKQYAGENMEIDDTPSLYFEFQNLNNDLTFNINLNLSNTVLKNNQSFYVATKSNTKLVKNNGFYINKDNYTTYIYRKSDYFYLGGTYDDKSMKRTIEKSMVNVENFVIKIIDDYITGIK